VVVGYGLLLGVSLRDAPGPLGGLVVGAVFLTVLVVARQITAVRETSRLLKEQATRASEARFRSLVQHASDVITILDEDSTIRYASPSVTRVFGYDPEAMVGHRLADFVHEDDRTTALAFMTDAVARPGLSSAMTWRIRGADGTWIRVENIGTNLIHDQNVGGLLLNTRDVSERFQLEEQLVHQAVHDPLTGLANRALFRNRVDHALARSRRKGGLVAVLFLDLDEFKAVNDSLGHAQGDRVLVSAAARLRSCLRASDTPARLGGDEFAVLLEEAADTVAVGAVAERITQAFQEPVRIGTMDLIVTASIGIAVATGSEESGDEILRNADVAMYMAKGRGRGRHEFFEPRMHTEVLERLEMQGDLRRAVEREEFLLHYQPILKMETGEIVGAEALVRWAHPTRGLVPPGAFIPLAEETGLIVPIGRWVLRKACQQARQWRERHGNRLTITVNLSGRQLHDPDLMWHVISALAESELEPRTLVLELTESVLMQNTEVTLQVLRELKTLGIRLAIDDFGTGYSSLSYLQRFPFDILKIAKSFVDTMGDGKDDGSTLARAIIALGDTLELQTVAEGIETAQQAQSLRMLGCDLAQGFHFAKPLPPVEFAEFAVRNRSAVPSTAQQGSQAEG
jgi:diguanylate cyclase (GGDEF)-like protein/PAS domain S-box-containing protein